jgi:hypothetical protein
LKKKYNILIGKGENMKKLISILILFFGSIIICQADSTYLPAGAYKIVTPINNGVIVSSSTVTIVSAINYGSQRMIANLSSDILFYRKDSSLNIRTKGFPIWPYTNYVESTYFGIIYLQSNTKDIDTRFDSNTIKP